MVLALLGAGVQEEMLLKGKKRMIISTGMVLVLLIAVAALFFRPVAAQEGGNSPGSAADPVFTRDSLKGYLGHLFAGQHRELDEIAARLDRVEVESQSLQGIVQAPFPDLRGHRAERAVNYLRSNGIISGCPDGKFHPDDSVTRATLAVMVVQAKQLPVKDGATGFPDVTASHWAAGVIGAARDAGFVRGCPDGRYYPEKPVTRAQVAAVLNQAFHPSGDKAATYRDLKGHWAKTAIENLAAAGIFDQTVDRCFYPDRIMTRAEIAVALARALSGTRF